jgi:hypothetical protein
MYATVEQLLARAPLFEIGDTAATAAAEALLAEASARIDAELRYPGDPVGPVFPVIAENGTPSVRTFVGTGTYRLPIAPHVGNILEVTVNAPHDTPPYLERGGVLLTVNDDENPTPSVVWPAGVTVTVSARWGTETVPGDVVSAVLDFVQDRYVRALATSARDQLPAAVASLDEVIERYRAERAMEALF